MSTQLAAAAMLLVQFQNSAVANPCPIDHLIFADQASKAVFVVEKVEAANLNDRGHGDTAFYGSLTINGGDEISVVAIYSVWDALPCCVWYSYRAGEQFTQASGTPPALAAIPSQLVELDEFTIDHDSDPDWPDDKGPLRGLTLEAIACRR